MWRKILFWQDFWAVCCIFQCYSGPQVNLCYLKFPVIVMWSTVWVTRHKKKNFHHALGPVASLSSRLVSFLSTWPSMLQPSTTMSRWPRVLCRCVWPTLSFRMSSSASSLNRPAGGSRTAILDPCRFAFSPHGVSSSLCVWISLSSAVQGVWKWNKSWVH